MAENTISNNIIVVTGFGPFGGLEVNDSWECVKRLKHLDIESILDVTLIIKEIPVQYDASEKEVLSLWKDYNPTLMIHTGVIDEFSMKLEKIAHKSGYYIPDVSGSCPTNFCCPYGTKAAISTSLDLEDIIHSVDSRGVDLGISNSAGKYLCEYTYYLSLCQDANRTLFVHIPFTTNNTITIEDKTHILKDIIIAVYMQMSNQNKN